MRDSRSQRLQRLKTRKLGVELTDHLADPFEIRRKLAGFWHDAKGACRSGMAMHSPRDQSLTSGAGGCRLQFP
jgi:hypothetical protein